MAFHKGYFTVPCEWHPKDIERGNEKAVVVSVFGQSTVDSSGFKTTPLELMLGKNVLKRDMINPISLPDKDITGIEGYYDPYRRIIFLHLTGALDSSTLLKSVNKLNDQLQEKGFLVVWSELRLQYARSLLLLFCMSHILLLWHPSHIFDITYIHLFRTLDSIRSKFQQNFADILKTVAGVSKDWQSVSRICSPRVLFIFSSQLIPFHVLKETGSNGKSLASSRSDKSVSTPLRKLELDLEYQIYRLLRKSRVITNISANSLFALPNNQPFVYLLEDFYDMTGNASNMIKKTLREICSISSDVNKALFSSVPECKGLLSDYGMKECSFVSPLSDPQDSESLSHTLLSTMSTERKRNLEHSFSLFLKQHIDEALTRGFDDSVGRHATPNLFEVPKVSVWFEAFHKLNEFFVESPEEDTEGNENQVVSSLRSNLETDIRFSDARCSKVFPIALSAYNEGLPSHYTRAHHQSKLDIALGILATQARGPMYDKYVKQLEETCEQIWQDGRIGCEVLSLTGKTCHHPLHTVTKEPNSSLAVMTHSSNIAYVSFCDCGRHQGTMEDPYSVKAANFDYYEKMRENFCSVLVLEAFPFPSFKSSVDDARAADVKVKSREDWCGDLDVGRIFKDNPTVDTDTPQTLLELSIESAGLSQGVNANPPGIAEEGGHEDEIIVTVKQDDERSEENSAEDLKGLGIDRQASTTEYLPTMLTTSSPAGLLPLFPSWSLVCLGPSSLYSHNAGICEQPGFLPGTNFLLPWDVTIKIKDKDKWPAIADSMGKKGFLLKNKKNRMGGDLSEFSVKIFLGTEYQCPRGHRFMMAASDRHLKASSLGHVKDTAIKISNSDMPLYFPCPCSRRNSFVNGQLTRLHVVTPKAPVHVTLNPQVQPSPDPCSKFIPQPPSSPVIKLSASAYWILRLPFVYMSETGPHYPPNPYQVNIPFYGKLLKGCYGISEITLDR